MNRETAIELAKSALANWLRYGEASCGIKHRYREGRWDIYSFDVGQWHILLSDNGGKLVHIADVSVQPSYFQDCNNS